jgi:hypothetical protein
VPAQNPNVMEVMQQAMSTANSAFEQMVKASTATIGNMTDIGKGSARKK